MSGTQEDRWSGHPLLAAAVRLAAVALPLLLAALAATAAGRATPGPTPLRLLVALLVALVVAGAVGRAARRLLPLAALLDLALLFPDRAPARFAHRAARRLDPGADAGAARGAGAGGGGAHGRRPAGGPRPPRPRDAAPHRAGAGLRRAARGRAPAAAAERDRLRWAALLHDLGKLDVAPSVLTKPGALDTAEWEAVREHPAAGARLATGLAGFLGDWYPSIAQHHERWDGGGYPAGLAGEQICRGARIVAVADAFEVMTGRRGYRRPVSAETARAELSACSGTQFDPAVVRALLDLSVSRLERVVGPLAFLAATPFVVPAGVGLAPGAGLQESAHAHAAALPSGHDAAGAPVPTGHEHGGAGGVSAHER